VGARLIPADGQTDMIMLIGAFRVYAKVLLKPGKSPATLPEVVVF
jgi:hypothetical protein